MTDVGVNGPVVVIDLTNDRDDGSVNQRALVDFTNPFGPDTMDVSDVDDPDIALFRQEFQYIPLPNETAAGSVICLPSPSGPNGIYSGPNPFDVLSNDIFTMILGFLPFRTFLATRLVCQRFNVVSQKTASQWRLFLLTKGPKKISENSVHVPVSAWRSINFPCRMGKNGKCNLAFHYNPTQLSPVFTENDKFAPYKESIDFVSKKKLESLKRRLKTRIRYQGSLILRKQKNERDRLDLERDYGKFSPMLKTFRNKAKRYDDQLKLVAIEIADYTQKLATSMERRNTFRAAHFLKRQTKAKGRKNVEDIGEKKKRRTIDDDEDDIGFSQPTKPRKARKTLNEHL